MSEQQIYSQHTVVPKHKMPCIVCGKLYSSKHFLQKHIMRHSLCPVEPPALPQNKCGYCGLQFVNSRIYIEHMAEVSKNLHRIKSDNPPENLKRINTGDPAEEAPSKVPKLEGEEDAMEIDNNVMNAMEIDNNVINV